MMKDFHLKLFLFLIPLWIYLFLAYSIDPFNVLRKEDNVKMEKLKQKIGGKLHYPLYKLNTYKYDPKPVLVFGDSRANKLKSAYFEAYQEKETFNLSFLGGTIPEILDTYSEVSRTNSIEKIYLGLNFNLYNELNAGNRTAEAVDINSSVAGYFFSTYSLKSILYISKAYLFDSAIKASKPPFKKKDKFWKYQLEVAAGNFYRNYSYPTAYYEGLKTLADSCALKNTELVFFIPPTHIELQNRVKDFELEAEEKRFKSDLASLGTLYDFDYPNELTKEKSNFKDPFHFNDSIAKMVVKELVLEQPKYAKRHSVDN